MLHIIIHSLEDCVKLLPLLFLTYLLLEYIEHKTEEGAIKLVSRDGILGPVLGAAVGIIPQCGFSASASSLFSRRVISAGTLIAVFLATSDEMLPILIANAVDVITIIKILGIKFVSGMAVGIVLDKLLHFCKHTGEPFDIHAMCEDDNCSCKKHNFFVSALLHTLKITAFILIINFILNAVIHSVGEEKLAGLILNKPVIGPVITTVLGLIPNCAPSIIITELYLSGGMSTGAMLSGLLAASGVGILVLFRINRKNINECLKITAALAVSSLLIGVIFDLLKITL